MKYLLLLVLSSCIFFTHRSTLHAQQFATAPSHFWIDCPNASELFDDQVLQLIAEHGAFFVPRMQVYNENPFYSLSSVLARSHRWNSSMPVLLYTHVTDGDTGSNANSNYLPDHILQGYAQLDTLLLHSPDHALLHDTSGHVLGDVRNPDFVHWIIAHIIDSTNAIGTDGVFVDNYQASAHLAVPQLCRYDTEQFCSDYTRGITEITNSLVANLETAPFVFNGLQGSEPYSDDQLELLVLAASGATIESFGYSPSTGDSTFTDQVLPYIRQMQSLSQFRIFANGRGKSAAYTGYLNDYRWQRYLYGCYLLGANSSTTFHYFTDFAIPAKFVGRSTPLDWYEDMDLNLGVPLDTFTVSQGVYTRPYSFGVVEVLPDGAKPILITLAQSYFTPEGDTLRGSQILTGGTALILLDSFPNAHPIIKKDFESASEPTATWQNASIEIESGNHFLHVDSLDYAHRDLHDIMLDWTHSLRNFNSIRLRTRTTDPNARLLIAVDIDDPSAQSMRAIIEVRLDGKVQNTRTDSLFQFRIPSIPAGAKQQILCPYFSFGADSQPDSAWHTIDLNADSIIDPFGFKFRRIAFMRIVGSMDVDDIVLPDTVTIPARVESAGEIIHSLQIHPNPTSGLVFVNTNGILGPGQITYEIYNEIGEYVARASRLNSAKEYPIDFSGMQSGMYFIRFTNARGVATLAKVLVQK